MKQLLPDDYISKQGLVPKVLPYRNYYVFYICKKLYSAKFLCNLERLETTYIHLKKAKNAIFA